MKRLHVILLAAFTMPTIGCDSGGGEYVKKMEEFSTTMCACKDAACVTKTSADNAEWLSKNAALAAKMDAKDAEKITAATTKMTECATKIATGAAK